LVSVLITGELWGTHFVNH